MRILLDESVPRRLSSLLVGHSVTTVTKQGWSGVSNGQLLAVAAKQFDVLITADRNMQYQQNLANLPMAIIVLIAYSNRLEAIKPLVPNILDTLNKPLPPIVMRIAN